MMYRFNPKEETPIFSFEFTLSKEEMFEYANRYASSLRIALKKRIIQTLYFIIPSLLISIAITGNYIPNDLSPTLFTIIGLISIVITFFGSIYLASAIYFSLTISSSTKKRLKKVDTSATYKYDFFLKGISISEPDQEGSFYWEDFREIDVFEGFITLTFLRLNRKEYIWTKHYKDTTIPCERLSEIQDVLKFLSPLENFIMKQ